MVPGRLSRRDALRLTSVSLVGLAGCASSQSDETLTLTQSTPTTAEATPAASSRVESIPTDHPALAWGVKLPNQLSAPPTVDPGGNSVYVGVREADVRTPVEGGTDGPLGGVFSLDADDGGKRWAVGTDTPVDGRPVVNDGWVYVVTGYWSLFSGIGQRIVAHSSDGTRRWETYSPEGTITIQAAAGDTIFAGTRDDAGATWGQRLFAVRSNGSFRWDRQAGDALGATVVNETLVYKGGNELFGYDIESGEERWHIDEEPIGDSRRGLDTVGDHCFTHTRSSDGTELVARSAADGVESWRYAPESYPGNTFSPYGIAATDTQSGTGPSLFGTEFSGLVFALDEDGAEHWTFSTAGDTLDRFAVGDAIYVGDREGNVYALDATNGRERWRVSLPDFPTVFPLSNGVLAFVVGEEQSVLASLRRDGSERWRYTTNEDLTWPAVAGERAYVGRTDGAVLAFDLID